MGEYHHEPPVYNATILQAWEWHCPPDGKHWRRLRDALPTLKAIGIDNLLLPPGCKGDCPTDNGYDIYDLYDLGEFDRYGVIRTKWGTKEELLELSRRAEEVGIGLYWDAVLNHKAGADRKERASVVQVDEWDRNRVVSREFESDFWFGFDFPGRAGKYSKQRYHWYHFTGTDYNAANGTRGIYRVQGDNKGWARNVDDELGNYDYVLFADLDYRHPEVQEDVKNWGEWITKEVGIKGFRLDAVRHFDSNYTKEWVRHVREKCGDIFMVGEFWTGDSYKLMSWLKKYGPNFCLFDVPLMYNFAHTSTTPEADMRKIFDRTLVKSAPVNAVTMVQNHDTQPKQAMYVRLEGYFKPLAYCLILLRDAGYPCIFYGDLYGTRGPYSEPPSCGNRLADMCLVRKLYAYGQQDVYLDHPNCLGFVRRGTPEHPAGLACVMSNTGPGYKRMAVGEMHRGQVWTDVLQWEPSEVTIDEHGYGCFKCPAVSCSIWVRKDAAGRERFPLNFDSNIYKE